MVKGGKNILQKGRKVKGRPLALFHHQGHRPGPPVVPRELHAVHVGVHDPRVPAQRVGHLGGAHVLALPPEGVAQAVVEEPPPVGVAAQRVARAVVRVAGPEHVPRDLLARRLLVAPVPAEVPPEDGAARVQPHEDLPALRQGHAPRAPRRRVALHEARLGVHGHGDVLVAVQPAQQGAVLAQGARGEVPAGGVLQAEHELGRVVELVDGVDAEALAEGHPHVGAEAVARDVRDAVGPVGGRVGRLREEVAEGLADVDEGGRAGGADVGPEGAGAEFLGDAGGFAGLGGV